MKYKQIGLIRKIGLVLLALLFVVEGFATIETGATAITNDGTTTREYLEDFEGYTVGSQPPPSSTFYSINTAGTTGSYSVGDTNGCTPLPNQCLVTSDTASPYTVQILNTGYNVNLCTNNQSLQFDMVVPDLFTAAVLEYRVGVANAVTGALPANGGAIRFTGLAGSTNQLNYVVRGNTMAENAGAVVSTTVSSGAILHATISQGNCNSGTASLTFAVTGQPTVTRLATAGDLIVGQINRVAIAHTTGATALNGEGFDNYDWQGAPRPTIVVTGLSPTNGFQGTAIAISGSNFQSGLTVKFDYNFATIVSVVSNEVRVTAPAHAPGTAIVTVTNPDGGNGTTSFFYNQPAPPTGNPNACKGAADQGKIGQEVLFDTYQGNQIGDIPDRCWFDFSTNNTSLLNVTDAAWYNTNNFRESDGSINTIIQSNDTKSLKITPAASGYNQQLWKIHEATSWCRAQGGTIYELAMQSTGPYRFGIIASADPTELQTPNSGSTYVDITPGAATGTLVVVNNDGTSVSATINYQILSGQWYYLVFVGGCDNGADWDFTTNTNPAAYSVTFAIFDSQAQFVSSTNVLGNVAKRPLSGNIDAVAIHCTAVCYEDAFVARNVMYVTNALSVKNCGGAGVSRFMYGMDYSYTNDFGIFKTSGPTSGSCGSQGTQVKTFDGNLNILGSLPDPPLTGTFANRICPGPGGVIAYQTNVGICFQDTVSGSYSKCLLVRNKFMQVTSYPHGQYEEGDANGNNPAGSLCEDNQGNGNNSEELSALDEFGLDFSNYCNGTGNPGDTVCQCPGQPMDGNHTTCDNPSGSNPIGDVTTVGYGFSEVTTGKMGAYVQYFARGDDDYTFLGTVQAGPSGSIIDQICAWRFGTAADEGTTNNKFVTNQYIAGIVRGQGVKMYRLVLNFDTSSASVPGLIEFREISLSNPALASAKALDCALDKMYVVTATQAIVLRVIPSSLGPVGQVVFSNTVTPNSLRLSAINEDGTTWIVGTSTSFYLYNTTNEANVHILTQGALALSTDNNTSGYGTLRLDRGFQGSNKFYYTLDSTLYLVNIDAFTHSGTYSQDPCATCGGSSGYQDTDQDGISDIFEPCDPPAIFDPDADDPRRTGDGIIDGNDTSITCDGKTYIGTVLATCSDNPGSCDPATDPGCISGCGNNTTIVNGGTVSLNTGDVVLGINVPATMAGLNIGRGAVLLLIAVVIMGAFGIWMYRNTESIIGLVLGVLFGFILAVAMGLVAEWVIITLVLVLLIVIGKMIFGGFYPGSGDE